MITDHYYKRCYDGQLVISNSESFVCVVQLCVSYGKTDNKYFDLTL